jgi:D-alanyl-D-alanine dipeptidase
VTTKEYCQSVIERDRWHKQQEKNFPIRENNSPLISLRNASIDLAYEPSIMKNYAFLVRKELIGKISRISEQLSRQDKTLIIRSTWRSFKHQKLLWNNSMKSKQKQYPDKSREELRKIVGHFIASEKRSTHATGGAVDALIYDKKRNCILDFGTNKGLRIDLNEKCYPYHPGISKEARMNRELLISLFEGEGFVCDMKEYWHFDYGNIGWAIEKNEPRAIYDIIGEIG